MRIDDLPAAPGEFLHREILSPAPENASHTLENDLPGVEIELGKKKTLAPAARNGLLAEKTPTPDARNGLFSKKTPALGQRKGLFLH